MFAFIFVYPDSKTFRLDPLEGVEQTEPLKRLALEIDGEARPTYNSAERVLEPGDEKVLGQGIYGTSTEGSTAPRFVPVDGAREGSDYDILSLASGDEKDPWLQIIAQGIESKDARVGRVLAAFPKLTDVDLQGFYIDRNIAG